MNDLLFVEHDDDARVTDKPHCSECEFLVVNDKAHHSEGELVSVTDKPHCSECEW